MVKSSSCAFGVSLLFLVSLAAAEAPKLEPVALPRADQGLRISELRWSDTTNGVLVPSGKNGMLLSVDPVTKSVKLGIIGLAEGDFRGGSGAVSADSDDYYVYAAIRGSRRLVTIDPVLGRVVASAKLGGDPGIVRYTPYGSSVWVTQPESTQIQVFQPHAADRRTLQEAAKVDVPRDVTAMVIDRERRLTWAATSAGEVIGIDQRNFIISARWKIASRRPAALALDEANAILFVAGSDGGVFALDQNGKGKVLGELAAGGAVASLDWDPVRRHLFALASTPGELVVMAVSPKGEMSVVTKVPVPAGAVGVASDRNGRVVVGDVRGGRVLVFEDPATVPAR